MPSIYQLLIYRTQACTVEVEAESEAEAWALGKAEAQELDWDDDEWHTQPDWPAVCGVTKLDDGEEELKESNDG